VGSFDRIASGPLPSTVVIVVTWNCRADIEECLRCLRDNTAVPDVRVVVIDNASQDGTAGWLRENARDVELVLLPENLGWVRSVNLGLERFPADHAFLLNPDAFVRPGWLRPLLEALEADPGAGFASPKFLYPDGSIHYAGAAVGRSRSIRVTGHGEPDDGRHDRPRRVSFAHGMCLVRRRVVEEVGLLDEGFGLGYFEEADYQLRARRQGFGVAYVPESVVVHATSAAFDQAPGGLKEELLVANWLRLIALHWPVPWLLLRVPLELARPLRQLLAGRDPRPTFRAWRRWAAALPGIRGRREALRRTGAAFPLRDLEVA
jgi:GT2 family glycosyltransferase